MIEQGLADTSLFIARGSGRRVDVDALPARLAVSVITIGELRAGVLAAVDTATRDRWLDTLTAALTLEPTGIDVDVANAWARLRVALRDAGLRMPVNRSWIAATAMALLRARRHEGRRLPGRVGAGGPPRLNGPTSARVRPTPRRGSVASALSPPPARVTPSLGSGSAR